MNCNSATWSKTSIASGSFTALWTTNKMFPAVWVTYRASLQFPFQCVYYLFPQILLWSWNCVFFFFPASISYFCSGTNAATSFMGYPSKDTATKIVLKLYVCEEYFSANSTILQDIFFKVRLGPGDWVNSRPKQVLFFSYVWCNCFIKYFLFPTFWCINPAKKGSWSWNTLSCFRKNSI